MQNAPACTASDGAAETPTRRCNKCKALKTITEFPIRTGAKRHGICKECFRAYSRTHYKKYRQRYLDRAAAQRAELIAWVRNLKKSTPCADCKLHFPYYVMDFDHLDGDEKAFGIAIAIQHSYSWRRLRAEIEKCEIVCANCHRIRTFQRMMAERRDVA